MKSGLLAFAIFTASGVQSARAAEPAQIRGQDLFNLFAGKTALSEYRTFEGIEDFRFQEFHKPDGTTEYLESGSSMIHGKWAISPDDKICYQYPGISRMDGMHCFAVFMRGDGCYYNYGYAVMTEHGPRNWDLWTSRFVREGHGGSCAPAVS